MSYNQPITNMGGVRRTLYPDSFKLKHVSSFRNFFRSVSTSIACAIFICLASCSKSDSIPGINDDDGNNSGNGQTTGETIDYSPLKKFLNEKIATADYCKSLTVSSSELRLTTVSGQNVSVSRGDVPYIMVNATGSYTVNGKTMPGKIPTLPAPEISVAGSGVITINGTEIPEKAAKGLYCIINTRKYLSFCFPGSTLTIPSEIYFPYNPSLPVKPSSLSVLFIGNSFTVDATEHLAAMVEASGIKNINLTRLYHGGYTLPEYNSTFSTPNVCARYDYSPGNGSWKGNSTLDDKPMDALNAREWDVIVIQEHTGRSEAWSWPGVMSPAIDGLRDKFYVAHPSHRPTIVYLLAQTYSNSSAVLVSNFGNDRSKMFSTTTSVVREMMDETGIDMVISSAATIENLRTSSINVNNGLQLTCDGYHLDLGISRYAVACAVFETLITPVFGNKISDCPYRYNVSSTEPNKYCTPVTDANAPIAQRAAHEATVSPFTVTEIR